MRGAILLTLVVVLGLVCVCCKGTDVKKSPEGSLLLDIDPKVANAPGDDKKKPGPENDPHGWRWRFRYRKGYRRRRYPSRRPYPPHHTHPPPPPTPATSVPCSSSRPDGVQWANEWTKSLDFECPKGQTLIYMKSDYSECHHDRIWAFGCGYNEASYEHCFWEHNFANDVRDGIFFNCPNHGFVAGVKAEYFPVGDRRYKFKCCNDRRFDHEACHQSPTLNKAGENLEFKVDRDKRDYITGISSCFHYYKRDRTWKIDYCKSVQMLQPEKKDVIEN